MNVYALRLSIVEKLLARDEGNPDRISFEYFIPRHYVIRNYSSRPKRVLAPLLPSMVFIRGRYSDIHHFQSDFSFFGFATVPKDGHRTPLIVPDPEMENFRRVVERAENDLTYYRTDELKLHKGEYIKVIGGVFDGVVAKLVKVPGKRNRKLVVELPGIAEVATTCIEPQYIRKISLKEYEETLRRFPGEEDAGEERKAVSRSLRKPAQARPALSHPTPHPSAQASQKRAHPTPHPSAQASQKRARPVPDPQKPPSQKPAPPKPQKMKPQK